MKNHRNLWTLRSFASIGVACLCATASAGNTDDSLPLRTTVGDAVKQMRRPHVAVPDGVPVSYSWRLTPVIEQGSGPPKDFHAITGWGQVFRAVGSTPTSYRIALRNLRTYVLRKSGELELVQASSAIDGAQFRPDYKDNLATPAQIEHDAEGNTVVRTEPFAAFHFWPEAGKVSIDPGTVKGVLVTIEARIEPEAGKRDRDMDHQLMLSAGADYWLAENSSWDRYRTNVGIGMGRFAYMSTQWQCYTMTTIRRSDAALLSAAVPC